ncbi:hypothetical protein [Maribacter sp. IgM3_T14_3]|uniref:hypothetical protein n=1 Tax=Maribacter sp. IgM3_T14_3 TaxID=3415140 RepID=UPI003C6F5A57
MYKVTAFEKKLVVEATRPYGAIKIYFENPRASKAFTNLTITKFMALSHLLENDNVGYDSERKVFMTNVEPARFTMAPDAEL